MEQITIKEVEAMGSDSIAVFGGTFEGGINLQQVPDEIVPCINDIIKSKHKIENFLEIGSAAGGTSFLFDRVFDLENIVIVDDNRHPKHELRSDNLKNVKAKVSEYINDSKYHGSINFVKNLSIKFDVILIDGDHSHDGVVSDINNYSQFLSDDGFLILHDTVACLGVKQAFNWQKKIGKNRKHLTIYYIRYQGLPNPG